MPGNRADGRPERVRGEGPSAIVDVAAHELGAGAYAIKAVRAGAPVAA